MLWGVRELAELSTEARELVLERFRLLVPHLEGERTLRSVAFEAGVPFRTAQRWVERYRKSGLAALARKGRNDDGGRRVYSQRILEPIEGLALERPPLPITATDRQVKLSPNYTLADPDGTSVQHQSAQASLPRTGRNRTREPGHRSDLNV
jgi:hypothetical protein